jgi:hypothetical protein
MIKSEITEEWLKGKAVELYNYLYYETFSLKQVTDFIRSLIEEVESGQIERRM